MRHHLRHQLRLRRTVVAVACLATAAVGLTACGSESGKASETGKASKADTAKGGEPKEPFAGMSGTEIVDKAVEATKGATSLRLVGDIKDDETGRMKMDLALDTSGKCAGTMAMDGEGTFDLIVPGDSTVYVKYDEKFLRAQSKGQPEDETALAVEMLADRWSKTKASGADAKDIAGMCDLDDLLKEFEGEINSNARRGATTTLDGTPAIRIDARDSEEKYTIYVATEGKPYLLKIVDAGAAEPEHIAFREYDKPVKTTPPAGKVIDLDELGA
ncbi:hypothetical protein [Streptomyces atriruber]|uniref:hypothetical protein n=1 Tax=Streptomyces atriruber TaxID=545121 RepID=UPI000A6C99D5|nr:hypothetical protein [Streptomyces atriruber]